MMRSLYTAHGPTRRHGLVSPGGRHTQATPNSGIDIERATLYGTLVPWEESVAHNRAINHQEPDVLRNSNSANKTLVPDAATLLAITCRHGSDTRWQLLGDVASMCCKGRR